MHSFVNDLQIFNLSDSPYVQIAQYGRGGLVSFAQGGVASRTGIGWRQGVIISTPERRPKTSYFTLFLYSVGFSPVSLRNVRLK